MSQICYYENDFLYRLFEMGKSTKDFLYQNSHRIMLDYSDNS